MRNLAVLVLLVVALPAMAQLSETELMELEDILKDYETVETLLAEGLTQLEQGQMALAQGLVQLGQGESYLSQQINGLEISLSVIEEAYKEEMRKTRKWLFIMGGILAVETALIIVFR